MIDARPPYLTNPALVAGFLVSATFNPVIRLKTHIWIESPMESEITLARMQLESLLEKRDALQLGAIRIDVPGATPEQNREANDYVVGIVSLMRRFGDVLHAATIDANTVDALDSDPALDVSFPNEFIQPYAASNPGISQLRAVFAAYREHVGNQSDVTGD